MKTWHQQKYYPYEYIIQLSPIMCAQMRREYLEKVGGMVHC